MHNIHYIIVEGESHEDAQLEAEQILLDSNLTENNWFSICGSLSQKDNSIDETKEGRWGKEALDPETIKKSIMPLFEYEEEKVKKLIKNEDLSTLSSHELYICKEYFNFLYEKSHAQTDDIWNASFYSDIFDEVGITNCVCNNDVQDKYIVLIDMHS